MQVLRGGNGSARISHQARAGSVSSSSATSGVSLRAIAFQHQDIATAYLQLKAEGKRIRHIPPADGRPVDLFGADSAGRHACRRPCRGRESPRSSTRLRTTRPEAPHGRAVRCSGPVAGHRTSFSQMQQLPSWNRSSPVQPRKQDLADRLVQVSQCASSEVELEIGSSKSEVVGVRLTRGPGKFF